MAKQYKWRTTFSYQNNPGSNYHLSYGVSPSTYDNWQTADAGGSGSSGEIVYYYRDSNTMYSGGWYDTISSQVNVRVTQSWTTSVDNRNNLTVSVTTVVTSVDRTDCRGNDQNTPGRNINIYKEQGGSAYISTTDNQVATAHNISGSVNLGTYTFTLAPGQNLTKNTLYIHNQTVGSSSYDDIWAGVQFQNPLPADYRPGAVLKSTDPYNPNPADGAYYSHNRSSGACHILPANGGTTWTEMRTVDGPTGLGDPPAILHDNKWYNQLLIGKE